MLGNFIYELLLLTSGPEGVGSLEESSEKLPDMCSVNFMERSDTGFPGRRSSLVDGDGHFSEDSCEEREERPVPKDPTYGQTLSDPNLDESALRSPSIRTPEYVDRNSVSSPSDIEAPAADADDDKGLAGKSITLEPSTVPKCDVRQSEEVDRDFFVRDCPSHSSAAGSDKDLRPVLPGTDPPAAPTVLSSNSLVKDFFSDEQNFVQKLESFVASMDRRTKLGPSAAISSAKVITHESYRSKPMNGVSKHSSNSKYLYYENCSRYIDGSLDQPLDLSVTTKDKQNGLTKLDSYDGPLLATSSRPLDVNSVAGVTGSSSLLASLEKKFGEHSQILDRIGTLPRACHFGSSLGLSRGTGYFAPKVSEVSDQVPGCWKNFSYPSASSISSGSLHFGDSRLNRSKGRDIGKTFHMTKDSGAVGNNVRMGQPSKDMLDPVESTFPKKQKTTSLRCSCNMEFDRLFLLTVHLQETGHKPSVIRADSEISLDNTKLVRGQDVWLHNGSEQTRQILRCMECHRSFRSLPELTVHMIQTEHYMNLIQPESTPRRIAAEPGSSSGSESGPDPFSCCFCSKVFEDADALGLHIVASGHYRRDVKQKAKITVSSSPPEQQPNSSQSHHSHHQNERKPTPATVVDYAEMSRAEKLADGDERVTRNEIDSPNESLELKKHRDMMMDYDSPPGFASAENDSNEIPMKIPRLECVMDHVQPTNSRTSPSGSSESTLPSVGGFYMPPSRSAGPAEIPGIPKLEPVDESSTRSPTEAGESSFLSAEPRDVVPDKESALTAMQSFINRSFGHSQEGVRSSQAPDLGRQTLNQKSLPWQPASNFLTKLTWPEHSPSRSRKRHHNDSDNCHRDGLLATENAESLSFRDRNDMRKCDIRSSQSYGESLFSAEGLWKSRVSDQGRDDRKSRYREGSPCFFPGQPFGGGHQSMVKHQMNSPVMPLSASSPLNELNSAARKLERSYEKDEKLSMRGSERTSEMSTLDSLQELVYSKSFKSLERFMHPNPTTIAYGLGGPDKPGQSHSLVISTKNSIKKTIPETLILVNPIVTVMPTPSGGGSSLSITLPQSYSSPDSETTKDNGALSGSPSIDATDSDGEQFGEFKCLTCKRNFASKGSYRYHRSRYHAYSDLEKSKMKDQLVTNLYSHLGGSEPTNKFSKYYQLASELSSKSN